MIILFQILFTLFVLFAIVSVAKRKQEGLLGPKGLIFWLLFWVLAIVAVLWPNSTTIVANYLGIGRGTDFVIYVALVIIFYLLFKLHIKLESVGRDITKVVRKEAVEERTRSKE
ncbi:MAG: DUF2304 family protein [Candidatus Magasanikiibacteriota bacterium]